MHARRKVWERIGRGTDIPHITWCLAHDQRLTLNPHLLHFPCTLCFILFKFCFIDFVIATIGFVNHMICQVKVPRRPSISGRLRHKAISALPSPLFPPPFPENCPSNMSLQLSTSSHLRRPYQSALSLAVSLDGLPRPLHTSLIFAFARDVGRRRDGRRAHFSLHLPTIRIVRMCYNACLFLHLPFPCYVSSAVFRARQIFDESAEAKKATSATMLECTFLFHTVLQPPLAPILPRLPSLAYQG
jgi:hypothetical protein